MLKQVSLLNSCALFAELTNPEPLGMGMYVFSNYRTGALTGVKYPLEIEHRLLVLLQSAHKQRDSIPERIMYNPTAAKRLGISQRTLQRWVEKGWIYGWPVWVVNQDWTGPLPTGWSHNEDDEVVMPLTMFSEVEVEALRLAKPCDL